MCHCVFSGLYMVYSKMSKHRTSIAGARTSALVFVSVVLCVPLPYAGPLLFKWLMHLVDSNLVYICVIRYCVWKH
jgi:hypothetical protein